MDSQFIPLTSLLAQKPQSEQIFLSRVVKRDLNPDGTDKGIVRRMQNEMCIRCHEEYQKKFPGQPFQIKCRGVYDEDFFLWKKQQMENLGEPMSLEEIREIYDPAYWGEKYLVVKSSDNDYVPFKPRWFQAESLRCTAPRKVDRWGRGMGKTMDGVCEELHLSLTRKQLETMIVCPQQTQAEQWYIEILAQIENSPSLGDVLASQKQSPYYLLRFNNGSIIKIFTAGSGSGKKGGSMRGQNPRRIRVDEQDFLAEADYDAIMPLLRRFKELTFHGSSTPTGLRGMYYRMCKLFPDYREFFHPITDHPDWSEEMKEACVREAKTTERYLHEFLAEFGSPSAGVFKNIFIDRSLYAHQLAKDPWDPSKRHIMGVDWNGEGTGTRIYVVQYDPETRHRKTVDRSVVDEPDSTTVKSIAEIKRLNKKWMCDHIYIDAGFGASQDELIRLEGKMAGKADVQTSKLKNIHKIDFGGSLEFNKLVPNREPGEKKKKSDKDQDEEKRRTKPFMVEGAVMAFEQEIVELSTEDDKLLIEQMRGYRVKTWSSHGIPASYETDAESGDHDLDAFMLAMLGIEIEYGLYHTVESVRRLAQIVHVASWGAGGGLPTAAPARKPTSEVAAGPPPSPEQQSENLRQALRDRAGIPSRVQQLSRGAPRVAYSGRGMAYVTPGSNPQQSGGRIPSRTDFLRARPPQIGSGGTRYGASPFNTVGAGLVFNR
jgi:hypothetical protein